VTALDTQVALETPEGVLLRLAPAGPVPRALAWSIDQCVVLLVIVVASLLTAAFGAFGAGLVTLLWFVLQWLYPVLFEVLNDGRTPGKRLMGIRAVHDDGTPLGLPAAAVRGLLLAVDGLLLAGLVGLVSMLCTRRFQRLGDLAAGTLVVHQRHGAGPAAAVQAAAGGAPPADAESALPVPVTVPRLLRDEQQLIVDFAARASALSPARQAELADLLADTVTGRHGAAGVAALRAVAATITGAAVTAREA
jgi:uncharacterized RDD family membrane protein YckC